jgi:cysteine-rich repeat protein
MDTWCDGDSTCGGTPINVGGACNDGNPLTINDTCQSNGTCAGIASYCGDGNIDAGEKCDDGDYPAAGGDGCDASCQIELYWVCDGEPSSCHRVNILFAIADTDDPAYRASVAAITGGAVNFYDAVSATPSVGEMQAYDCVFTHSDYQYLDATTMGNNLASYVDWGGTTVIGVFSLSSGWPLLGAIMGSGYCPVYSPSGGYSTTYYNYAGDGASMIHYAVSSYGSSFQNDVAVWGSGVADGHYTNGVIAHAYRSPDYKVVFSNGYSNASTGWAPAGDWARLIANSCSVGYYLGY